MATKKKLLQAAAGSAGGEALNVEDVFSTYLYEGFGTSTDKQIINGVNLADEGGMVWIKSRTTTQDNTIFDTERGVHGYIVPNKTDAQYTPSGDRGLQSYNTDGFTIPSTSYFGGFDQASSDLTSWTFRKAPKFFDVVTYTGDGTSSQQITHNLGVTPGLIIVKAASSVGSNANWLVWHRSFTQSAGYLNSTQAFGGGEYGYSFNQPSDTYIDVKKVGSIASGTNDSGITYVAYLFAHNDGDGEFGPDGDADIIKCGSYTGNGSTNGPEIDLGFEPQWILTKNANNGYNWIIHDAQRGISTGSDYPYLMPNQNTQEVTFNWLDLTPTGFKIATTSGVVNGSGNNHIYIAIRRGPMAVPTDATDVFSVDYRTSNLPEFKSGFVSDFALRHYRPGADHRVVTRLLGKTNLVTNSTAAEVSYDPDGEMDFMNGWGGNAGASTDIIAHTWKRAPNYFDVVAYTGNGTAGRTVSHNLGVAPEMIWVKVRSSSNGWPVWHKDTGSSGYLQLEANYALTPGIEYRFGDNSNYIAPTDTEFTVGSLGSVNGSGSTYIAYLFASLDGVSKVGSYTGNGSTLNIDCGFTSGARFVLIKRTDGTGSWEVWDTERGIVTGSEGLLRLNNSNAEVTADWLDPYSGGFQVSALGPNAVGGTYIFYAIA